MDIETLQRLAKTARRVVNLLVEGDYARLEGMCGGVRLSAAALGPAVREYGRTLCRLPEDRWDRLDVVEATGPTPRRFSVRVDLWTVEEGRSDLSLELTLVDEDPVMRVEIDASMCCEVTPLGQGAAWHRLASQSNDHQ